MFYNLSRRGLAVAYLDIEAMRRPEDGVSGMLEPTSFHYQTSSAKHLISRCRVPIWKKERMRMAKKQMVQQSSITDVVNYYQKFIQHEMDNQLKFYKDYLVKNQMWIEASNTLLGGSHLYRLIKGYPLIRQNTIADITKHKLYDPTQIFSSFCCLHKCVEKIIHRPHIGAVAIYDVAKFVGYSLKKQVLPCNDVYIHTVVINGLKFLANKGYVNITQMQKVPNILWCWTIPLTAFDLQLQKLDSLHLEDLLCAIGHNCNRKGNLKPTNVYSLDSIPKAIDHCFYEILKNL